MKTLKQLLEQNYIRIKLGQGTNPEKANNFIKDFHKQSLEHPFHRSTRIFHNNAIDLSRDGSEVHIHDIVSLDPNKGHGTKGLKELTKLADKHGVKLNLHALAYTKDPNYITHTPTLIKWYKKHGFQHEDPDYDERGGSEMKYYPKGE